MRTANPTRNRNHRRNLILLALSPLTAVSLAIAAGSADTTDVAPDSGPWESTNSGPWE